MKKISFLIDHFGPNQISYLLARNIPPFIQDNPTTDVCVFYENIFQNAFTNNFCCLPSIELWSYKGACISIGFEMAKKTLAIPTLSKRVHYLFDLDWTLGLYNSSDIEFIYTHPDLEFAVRNQEYADIFRKRWWRDCYIFGDLDVQAIDKNV